jgi:hypothetical protein
VRFVVEVDHAKVDPKVFARVMLLPFAPNAAVALIATAAPVTVAVCSPMVELALSAFFKAVASSAATPSTANKLAEVVPSTAPVMLVTVTPVTPPVGSVATA